MRKIDIDLTNINMRDPVMFRILKAEHHRTGNTWCIYPCMIMPTACLMRSKGSRIRFTLEFEDHRPLYDWFLDELRMRNHPQQISWLASILPTVISKRKLLQLVRDKHVRGWDDPRMPTIQGLRRRGYSTRIAA